MRKILYNSKMKKILAATLIVLLLWDFIMPNVVLAATENIEHGDYDFSYADWIGLKNNAEYGKIIEKYGVEKYENDLKDKIKKALCQTVFFKENVEDSNKAKELAENLLLTNPEGIMVNGTLQIGTNLFGGAVCKFEIKSNKNQYGQSTPEVALKKEAHDNATEVTKTYNELLEWSGKSEDDLDEEITQLILKEYFNGVETLKGNATSEDAAKKILELNKDTIELKVIGEKDNYKITGFEVPGKDEYTLKIEAGEALGIPTAEDEKDSADLGGLLLSPVLSLINFVADAVMSVTQKIMMPEKASLIKGVLVHNVEEVGTEYEKTVDKKENTSAFLPSIGSLFSSLFGGDSVRFGYPNIVYTPEEIFAGKVDLLSIDFISGKNYQGEENKSEGWLKIREVISQWYQILRMIAIIGLLSVLIYTGIKIIISSNAKDKAKYKEWISNWFMAVAILFSMHFIMAFIISTTGEFSKLLAEACQGIHVIPSEGGNPFNTNLMGYVRFMVQSEDFYIKVGYEVMYIALIVYTLKFTMVYLKRVLNMAFLTLIAPIVALTYPIDKINDGRAQGFDMWLKEYIFNALLQPMHQVLYYVLVGSAVSVAVSNPLYGIAVLAFMTQAEKLLKKIFGFDKAGGGTVGGMSTAFAAGALASNLSKLAKLPKGNGGKGGDSGSAPENIPLSDLKATTKDNDKDDALFKDSNTNSGSSENNEPNNSNNENDSNELEEENEANHNGPEEAGRNREQPQNGGQGENTGDDESTRQSPDDGTPIREKIKNSKLYRGSAAVGKRLAKPVWDFDHKGKEGRKYNRKRLRRKIGRAALGASLGIGAAAVQAGISITDGKYNPMEGIASFAAGYAGGGQIAKGIRSLGDTYMEGTLPDDPEARKTEQMKRVLDSFSQRDDVIKHNRSKYASADREKVINIQKQLLEQGVTDLGEMDDIIKYIKKTNNGSLVDSKDTVRKARTLHDFSNDSNVQKVMYDPDKTEKYINTVAGNDAEKRKILENKFKESIRYANIVNKK